MAIPSSLDEFFVSRKYNEKEKRPVMDYETPINVESDAIASDAEMAPYMQDVYEDAPSVVEQEEAIEQAVRQPAAQPQGQSPDSNLWYFLPAALGALTGNIGEGSAASAGAIGDARKRQFAKEDYEKTLSDKLKMLQAQRKGDSKLYEVDKEGKAVFMPREQAIGQQAYKASKTADDGKDIRQLRAQDFAERMKLNDRQDKAMKDFTAPNGEFTKHLENMQMSVSAMKQLNEGGPIAESGLPSLIARGVFKEKGVLTEQDVQRVGGDPSLIAQYNRTLSKALRGEGLTPDDRRDVAVLLKVGYQEEIDRMNKVANKFVKTRKAVGLDIEEPVKLWLKESTEGLPSLTTKVEPSRMQRQSRVKRVIQTKPRRVVQDGVTFVLNEKTGEYEQED